MAITISKWNIAAVIIAALVILLDFYEFKGSFFFAPLIVVALLIAVSPVYIEWAAKIRMEKEIEEVFPDFVRNLVSAIRSGMPLAKSILHVSNVDYRALTPYVKKLATQVEWNIPVKRALMNFANATGSRVIKRTIFTVIEAETAGGNIEDVLESVTDSVVKIKKMRERRSASVHSSIIQNYVIFIVFLATMVVVQNLIMPYVSGIGAASISGEMLSTGTINTGTVKIDFSSAYTLINSLLEWAGTFKGIILMVSLIQGFFSGIILGKMAEGMYKAGIKHSVAMMLIAFVVIVGAQSFV